MTELWKFAWQLRSFHDLTIWNLTIWNKWKYCICDKQQFDKGQIETGQIEKGHFWKGIFERAFLKGHIWIGITERAFWWRTYLKGHFQKGISERAFWWRALKGRSFWGKVISEGQQGKGHEEHCAWTKLSPNTTLSNPTYSYVSMCSLSYCGICAINGWSYQSKSTLRSYYSWTSGYSPKDGKLSIMRPNKSLEKIVQTFPLLWGWSNLVHQFQN